MIWSGIVEISVSVQKSLALLWYKDIKNLLYYHDFTAVVMKLCKRCEHGGFLQSWSHIYKLPR